MLSWSLTFLGVALISGMKTAGAYGVDPIAGTVLGLMAGVVYSAFLMLFREGARGGAHPVTPLSEAMIAAAVVSLAIGSVDGQLDFTLTWPAHGWLGHRRAARVGADQHRPPQGHGGVSRGRRPGRDDPDRGRVL